MLNWSEIDTVMLDMDGTLLDLHFDNHFWLEHVPKRFAESNGLELEAAKDELMARYQAVGGTLQWYCVDHWSQELGLDIALLKEEVDHLIAIHPHVIDFLNTLRQAKKKIWLVTNAHQKALSLKMEKTQLAGYFDRVVTSHDLGWPKEDQRFWHGLQDLEAFELERTLFVDDSMPVLESAKAYGIGWLLMILKPDSKQPAREASHFLAVHDFSEIEVSRALIYPRF